MCLIIQQPQGVTVPEELLESAFTNNSDGMGIMFATRNNAVKVHKFLPKTMDQVMKVYNKYKDNHLGIHFRLRTNGDITADQAHPYPVLNKKQHGRNVWMMHNGILSSVRVPEEDEHKSDTWHFIEYFVRPILIQRPEFIKSDEFIAMIEEMIGGTNKLLFLDGGDKDNEAEFIIANERRGEYHKELWLSNTYSLNRGWGSTYGPLSRSGRVGGTSCAANYNHIWDGAHSSVGTTQRTTVTPNKGTTTTSNVVKMPNTDASTKAAEESKDTEEKKETKHVSRGIVVKDDERGVGEASPSDEFDAMSDALDAIKYPTDDGVDSEMMPTSELLDWVGTDLDPFVPGNEVALTQIMQLTESEVYQLVIANPEGVADLITDLSGLG